jgi:cytochrome b
MLVFSAAYIPLAVWLDRLGSTEHVGGFLLFYLALVLAWGIGGEFSADRQPGGGFLVRARIPAGSPS